MRRCAARQQPAVDRGLVLPALLLLELMSLLWAATAV
jgi:hypothetical protein